VTYGYSVKETLRKAAKDKSIKGVILEMSTPGGTIYGSAAIADGVREYQKTGRPVLAFVAGLSASGGMWGMAPADRILADHGSLVGSIGVIMGPFAYYDGVLATEGGILGGGITTKNGITQDYITAGRSKDVGNPYRKLTVEERASLQAGVDAIYAEFVKHVATYRKIPEATIRDTLGAMIFSNAQAEQLGLIDGTASREDSYAEAATMAKINGTNWAVVREKNSRSGLAGLLAGAVDTKPTAASSSSVCFPPNTALAYYGDVTALCPN
jgi:protease-4